MTTEMQNENKLEVENTKTIFDCWCEAVRRFFEVKGRTTRYEFWAFQVVSLAIFVLASLIGLIFGSCKIVFEIYALYFIIPTTAISVRRLHDMGISGKWCIPVAVMAALVLLCWELNADFILLPVFLLLCVVSYLYYILGSKGENDDNVYGTKVEEPSICDEDGKIFVMFMAAFLAVLWIIFLIKVIF